MPRPYIPRRVTVISASVGAGHDGAAAELSSRLEAIGFAVDRYDFVDLLPAGLGRLLSAAYHRLLVLAPALYQRIYAAMGSTGRPGLLLRPLLRCAERRTLATVTPATAAVVSTYPAAGQVLGSLRERGLLRVPVLTYLTDFSVHPLWVAPGVDAHLAAHAVPAEQARALGARGVLVAGPVTGARFRPVEEQERRAMRERLDLPADAVLALLVAGSWGVGEVRRAAQEIRDGGAAVPVVVCGANRTLLRRLRADGFAHVRGWESDMPTLMRACDVLVQNAGGLTSLEAFATGLPVLSYRCIPGHGRTNAAALDVAGLAPWVRSVTELHSKIAELASGALGERQRSEGLALFPKGPGPTAVIVAAAGATSGAAQRPYAGGAVRTFRAGGAPAAWAVRIARASRVPRPRRTSVLAAGLTLTLGFGVAAPLLDTTGTSVPVRLSLAAHRFLERHEL
ncbi:MGDG synthase family glycosyltransferase [Streptomyces sp. 8L]|uniref:MGDG synthase family glycosyltransferase n=1 Tax=Streptomyces sp. 8L TaxID=2877242 RepID=UPI001CD62E79|nr:UDP-N-acetylglucosamine--N-acetylglucosamine transferase [Streptomyces sp. 8L]MCA1219861.1 UDP-N-acetylglucosamine--N-acetylglucosamine transferase [Streptomyces sp. 8L]